VDERNEQTKIKNVEEEGPRRIFGQINHVLSMTYTMEPEVEYHHSRALFL